MNKKYIRDFYNRIIGSIEEDSRGNKVVRDFYGRILGRYDSVSDVTTFAIKTFNGSLKDSECIKLAAIDRGTYYKYKRELLEEGATNIEET